MELVYGRPADTENREDREVRVYDLLDSLQIPYWRIDHQPIMTMEACREVDQVLDAVICKNLFLCNKQKTKFYLLMLPGDKRFKTSEFSKKIGSTRLDFGPEEKLTEYLDLYPGSVSVMGLMNDKENQVLLAIDDEVLNGEWIGCHPCKNTTSMKFRMKDLIEKFLPAVGHEPVIVKLSRE